MADEFDTTKQCLKRRPPHCRSYAEREALRIVAERAEFKVSIENGVRLSRYMRVLLFAEIDQCPRS